MTPKPKVLFVDDEPAVVDGLIRAIRQESFETFAAHSAQEALDFLKNQKVDAIVADQYMPGMSGLELLQHVAQQYPQTLRLILTGHQDLALAHQAIQTETVFRFFTKPCHPFDLAISMRQGLHQKMLEQQNHNLKQAINSPRSSRLLDAHSATVRSLSKQVERITDLDSTVLITGESGTGKTSIARMIHESSHRSAHPFVTVNCAALPRDLVESELFGHERGAFTGAISTRPGRIELAEHGTLFLDEIGDMPLELQPKLLTFLDDRRVQRIGGKESRVINVRVIAATNQNLAEHCQSRSFREDLYFRLNVFTLHIPPLRIRKKDLGELIDQTLIRIAQSRNHELYSLSQEARQALFDYPWPGNIRELENTLERSSAFCDAGQIIYPDLALPQQCQNLSDSSESEPFSTKGKTLAQLESEALLHALDICQGNKAAAARQLGISEKSVYNKLKRLHSTPTL